MGLLFIIIIICAILLLLYIYFFGDNNIINALDNNNNKSKELFYSMTDLIWRSACCKYGSFDKIPKEEKHKIYLKMDDIAKEVGYKDYDISQYI